MALGARSLLLPLGIGLLLIVAFARLGFWQLERAHSKESLLAQFGSRREQLAQTLDRYRPLPRFTPVEMVGRLDPERLIYLDNQTHQGRVGVHVFAPLQPSAGGPSLLVNLGWLATDAQRRLPDVEVSDAPQAYVGLLTDPPAIGLRLGDDPWQQARPWRVPYLDLAQAATALNLELAPQILLASAAHPRLVRDWSPTTFPPERHRGYAFQWFALAIAIAVLVLWGTKRLWQSR